MNALRRTLHEYWLRDISRLFWLRQSLFWVPFHRYEFTRLQSIRAEMDEHKTFNKETILDSPEGTSKDNFIWSYMIRPVRKE
jgi:hypothetical protein